MSIKKLFLNISTASVFVLGLFFSASTASAGTIELQGNAWSGNIGWISFNCADTNTCSTSNYKVVWEDTTGYFSGYAWSDNIGWIYFDPALSSCPNSSGSIVSSINCRPKMMYQSTTANGNTYTISGFARSVANSSNWSGYIDLSGMTLGFPTPANSGMPRPFSGYIWGSDVLGWIDTSGVFLSSFNPMVSTTLISSNQNVSATANTTILSWSFKNAVSCTKSKTVNGVNQTSDPWVTSSTPVGNGTSGGSMTVTVGSNSAIYSITCVNNNTANKTSTSTINISMSPSVTIDTSKSYVRVANQMSGVANINSVNATNIVWTATNATSCVGKKELQGIIQPDESSGVVSDYQWSGTLWSGTPSNQTRTHTVYVGGLHTNIAKYTVTCTNSNNGKSSSASINIPIYNMVDDLLASKNLVDYPFDNNTTLSFSTRPKMVTVSNGYGYSGPTTPPSTVKVGASGQSSSSGNAGYFAQSFIASTVSTGNFLQKISFYIKNNSISGNPGPVTVSVAADNNGVPGATLASMAYNSPIAYHNNASYSWVDANFTNLILSNGKKYWIVLRSPSGRAYDFASVASGDLKYAVNTSYPVYSNFSPSTTLYHKIYLSNFNPTSKLDISCSSKKYVNNVSQITDPWFSNEMNSNSSTYYNNTLFQSFYGKTVPVGPTSSKYQVTCSNILMPAEFVTMDENVNVINSLTTLPQITSFTASPASFTTPTGNTTLSWVALNAVSCNLNKISPSYSVLGSNLPIVGSDQDSVSANSTYQLSCTDGINVVSKNLDVSVNVSGPAPTATLNATISPVTDAYRNTVLYWTSSNTATSCRLTRASDGLQLYPSLPSVYGPVTNNNASNGIPTSVSGTEETYTVECRDNYSQSGFSSKNIKVVPPIPAVVGFGVGTVGTLSSTAVTGSTKTLVWNVSGVSSCTASSNPGTVWQSGNILGSGNTNVTVRNTAGNQQYTLSCLDTYGIAVSPVVVNITVQIPGPVVDRFEAFPSVITNVSNSEIRLEWDSSNTNSCALSRISPDNVSYGNNLPSDGIQNNVVISTNGSAGTATDIYRVDCVQDSTGRHDSRNISVQVDTLTKKIKVIER